MLHNVLIVPTILVTKEARVLTLFFLSPWEIQQMVKQFGFYIDLYQPRLRALPEAWQLQIERARCG